MRTLPENLGGNGNLDVQLQHRDKVIDELFELLAEAYKELDSISVRVDRKEGSIVDIGKRTIGRLFGAFSLSSKTA